MMCIRKLLYSLPFLLLSANASAQSTFDDVSTKFAAGIAINQLHRDFGVEANFTSPYFANGRIAFRLHAGINWMDMPLPDGGSTWQGFFSNRLGVVARKSIIEGKLSTYGEAGGVFMFPHSTFSAESFKSGGYGLIGVAFNLAPDFVQYLEIGAMGTGARADRLANSPVYGNGLIIGAGFSHHF
ncbi:hypothetical protein H8S90_23430 [Olivibacter sp. SDN3]|uniref:hypothetical protein n=1 Tax=Olivibacter sp. SDN3 TaxID=2764720 RepID=UPI0016518F85|nr:hypothetical protein [Olivibacter sp. SDN3]QNL49635.1 hypothetical protein H8S90_23430 [Olivibacter sp. SDN3]